ncbi:PIN domain-containing protein [Flexivirga sp. ID2601S]|uniref:PIN domain-containing protein n=1 Tax=Flexivirga aerilata TaxID=1656889 RepID=A0A849AE49_9MICO|nr:PIN domain-containing protein [Flexivirga aerilata]
MPDDFVLVDTDVWSHVIPSGRDRDPRASSWRRLLLGKQVLIAAQTEGELRFGALAKRWGATKFAALEANLTKTPTVPVTNDVIESFASVRAACRHAGHALAEKIHVGDAWIAATAIAFDLPLLAGDRIYRGVEGLRLVKDDDD